MLFVLSVALEVAEVDMVLVFVGFEVVVVLTSERVAAPLTSVTEVVVAGLVDVVVMDSVELVLVGLADVVVALGAL